MKLNKLLVISFLFGTSLVNANEEVPVRQISSSSVEDKIEDLQMRVQEINGELELLNHRIQKLEQSTQVLIKTRQTGAADLEEQLYFEALNALPGHFAQCETKLREYLKHYPNGRYLANVHYCLAELNRLQNNWNVAEEHFQIVINRFNHFNKKDEATFKIALVYHAQGRKELALKTLRDLINPNTDLFLVKLAKQQLQQWEI